MTTADQRDRCLASAILRVRALLRGATVSFCLGFALMTVIAPHFNPVMARTTDGAPLSGATADLFKAVEVNDMPGVKAALAAGADITAKNATGKTPADLAVDRGHFIIAHFLLSQRPPAAAPPSSQSETKSPPTRTPAPRRLTPAPRTATAPPPRVPRTAPPADQSSSRFTAPPAKPAPADDLPAQPAPGSDLPEVSEAPKTAPIEAAEPARALTPPPLPKRAAPPKRAPHFAAPPRKPQPPLPEAVEVAKAPGGVDLPPLSDGPTAPGTTPAVPPGDQLPTGPPSVAGDLPPAGLSDDALPSELSKPSGATTPPEIVEVKPADAAPPAAMPAPATKPGSTQPLGKVGQFFRNLLDIVTPDDPAAPSAPRQSAGVVTQPAAPTTGGTRNQAMVAPASPSGPANSGAKDARLAAELEKAFGLSETPSSAPAGDVVELKEMEQPAGVQPPASETRRVPAPEVSEIRRSVPAPQVVPAPMKAPAESATSRTLDRIGGLVGSKPKEDEFGLPKVEISGSPSERPEPLAPAAVPVPMPAPMPAARPVQPAAPAPSRVAGMPAGGEPTLESLLGTAPKQNDDLPPAGPAGNSAQAKASQGPNIDDAPGPERNDPVSVDEGQPPAIESAPKAMAGTPIAAPKTPVASAAMPGPSGKLRYMSTTERLRRLNEALSRDVPLDAPARREMTVLTPTVTDYMITGVQQPPEHHSQAKAPPSSLPTRPLTQRDAPTDRFIDRLENIRRKTYKEERAATPPASEMAPAPAPIPQPAQAAAPAAPAAPAPAKEDNSALGRLVKFFRQADTRKAAPADADQQAQAMPSPPLQIARQPEYRAASNIGAAKSELPRPKALSEEAIKQTAAEPPPGQSAGRMTPGFLDHLSKLFTDQKVAEKGWAAEVELNDPKTPPAPPAPTLKSVPKAQPAESASAQPAAPAAASSLPAPSGDLPPGAGTAWTTTVEMATDTGNPMVLGVAKTPVPAGAATLPATPAPQMAAAAPRATASASAPVGSVAIKDDGLPPAEGENIVINDSPLPPAGDALPPAKIDDLPPAQGEAPRPKIDDLPPAQGEAPMAKLDDLPPAQGEAPTPRKAAPRTAAAKPPYSDPLQQPMPQPAAPPPAPQPLGRMAELRTGPNAAQPIAGESRLRPDEKLNQAAAEPSPGQTTGAANQTWSITKLAKVDDVPPVKHTDKPEMLSRTSLSGVSLTLGESVSLENSLPPDGGSDEDNRCVKKNRGTTLFCIEPVDWPDALKGKFTVPTILYTGPMAIVRYDQGTASRLHSLFPSDDFEAVVQYFTKRFGPPTEIWKRSIAPLAQPRRENPTVAWRNRDPKTNAVTILELRQFDDTRGGFPDTQRGAAMLYLANSPTIFPQVSSHELMRLKRDKAKQAMQQQG